MATSRVFETRHWVASAVLLALSATATYYMRLNHSAGLAVGEHFTTLAQTENFIFPDSEIVLRRSYTGIAAVDTGLSFLVAAFLPGASGLNKAFQLQQAHFLFSFMPVLAILSVEASRERNVRNSIVFTSVWALFYQTVGGAIIIPLWYLGFIIVTSRSGYYTGTPEMRDSRARTLLTALLVGYALPTALAFQPLQSLEMQQFMVALWQPCPLFVNLIWWGLSRSVGEVPAAKTAALDQNLAHLNVVYWMSGAISAIAHLASAIQCVLSSDPELSLGHVFVPTEQQAWSMSEALLFIFQIDFWIIFAASIVCCYFAVWDLHKLQITRSGYGTVLIGITIGSILLGPGATLCATWYWREQVMRNHAVKRK